MAFLPTTPPKEIEDKFSIANNTLTQVVKANPRDEIGVEVGDSKQPDFKPQFKFMRWDNEVNFSLRAEEHPLAVIEILGKKIKYVTPNYEVHQYDKPELSEDGGFEFEWVLPKKPASNVLTATIETKGLNFFFQPPLTQQEIDEGAQRPENVVGSYAVYHKTKGGLNDVAGMEYKIGKAFHIYRPKVTDANGDSVWGELKIDEQNGLLTVTIDQTWLDNAVYPVVVDPTFGYTTVGATSGNVTSGSVPAWNQYTSPAENGDITSISFAVGTGFAAGEFAGNAIYSDSSDSPNAKLAEDSGNVEGNGTDSWKTTNLSYSFLASTKYWLARFFGSAANYKYDTGTALYTSRSSITFENWPDPAGASAPYTRTTSIYATYTASGGEAVPGPGWKSLLGVGQFLFALFLRLWG